jgi:hypothetical protein
MTSLLGSRTPVVKWEISLGNIALLLGMAGSVLCGVYEGGRIQQTLQDGIASEASLRSTEIASLSTRIDEVRNDVRDVRNMVITLKSGKSLP